MSTVIQRSFAYGELAPEMRAKADLSAYSLGLKTARNVIVGKAGGIFNRPGTISLTKASPIAGTDAHILGRIGNYLVVLSGTPFSFIYNLDGDQRGSTAVGSYSLLTAYPLDGVGEALNGINPPYREDEVKDVNVTSTENGFLLCHEKYSPLEVFIDESGSVPTVNWRLYRPRPSLAPTANVNASIRLAQVGVAGTTRYAYQLTEVDEFGIESGVINTESITNAHRRLDAANYVRIELSFQAATLTSRQYNIYKQDDNIGEYRLLGILLKTTANNDSIFLDDIGQPLGDRTLPTVNRPIGPIVFRPEHINHDNNDADDSLENASVSVPITPERAITLVGGLSFDVGDKVAVFARYAIASDAATINRSLTTSPVLTVESRVVGTITFEEDLTSLFPSFHLENDQVAIDQNHSALFKQGVNPRIALQFQSRQILASTSFLRNTLWFSRIGSHIDFSRVTALEPSAPFSFGIQGAEGGDIQSILDINGLYIFGSEIIWRAFGNEAGVITPTQINLREVSNFGTSALPALKVGNFAFIEQQGGGIIRALSPGSYATEDTSSDVSLFSNHFVRDNRIISWTFAKRPVPIVWMVRDDGALLSLTFESSQGISAWCKHDISRGPGGTQLIANDVKSIDGETYIAAIARGTETNGLDDRIHIMKMDNRFSSTNPVFTDNSMIVKGQDIVDVAADGDVQNYRDATVDSNNLSTIALSATMTEDELSAIFPASSEGNYIFYEDDGEYYADRVAGVDIPGRNIVVERKVERTTKIGADELILGVNEVTRPRDWFWYPATEGTYHYSIVGDGDLVGRFFSNIFRFAESTSTRLPRGYREVIVGHPITSDIETLDIDLTGPTISQSFKKITEVNAYVDSTLGLYAGNARPAEDGSVDGLALFRPDRKWENNGALEASEGLVSINIDPTWNSSGAVFIRQIDPLPLAIYSIAPSGSIPSPGSGGI